MWEKFFLDGIFIANRLSQFLQRPLYMVLEFYLPVDMAG